jgi:tetratricopeptide (TPR) repeat protein
MPVSKRRGKKSKSRPAQQAMNPPPIADRRALEGLLALMTEDVAPDDPLTAAQELIYDAWDTPAKARRVSLARKALALSADCADAYVLLALETAGSVEEACDLYARGMAAGERALGRDGFEEYLGHFWGFLETRPYMRARQGLATALWELGSRDEAIAHYRDMLRLNPNDNQGIRYLLANCLLERGDDAALESLLKSYKDDGTANWGYTWALLEFRKSGDGQAARRRLKGAAGQNVHVPVYLLGEKKLPKKRADYITWGGEDEAQEYVRDCGAAWRATAGALEWLQARSGRTTSLRS